MCMRKAHICRVEEWEKEKRNRAHIHVGGERGKWAYE